MKNPWKLEYIERIRVLLDENNSCARIALAINEEFGTNFTRSAVIAKLNRLGISNRTVYRPEKKKTPEKESKPPQDELHVSTAADDEAIPGKPLAALKMNECHWPIGNPRTPGFRFCGAPGSDGRSYCPAHCDRAYVNTRAVRAEVDESPRRADEVEMLHDAVATA